MSKIKEEDSDKGDFADERFLGNLRYGGKIGSAQHACEHFLLSYLYSEVTGERWRALSERAEKAVSAALSASADRSRGRSVNSVTAQSWVPRGKVIGEDGECIRRRESCGSFLVPRWQPDAALGRLRQMAAHGGRACMWRSACSATRDEHYA